MKVMMRKAIQILAPEESELLFALCDDGSVWVIGRLSEGWRQLPDIPECDEQQRHGAGGAS